LGILQKSLTEKSNGNEDLITLLLAFSIGYIQNNTGPQPYHYQDTIVVVDKKYQCPNHCAVHHQHSVYYDGYGMTIDKNQLGKKVKKKKKIQEKIKR
jgi:hypothetical protein